MCVYAVKDNFWKSVLSCQKLQESDLGGHIVGEPSHQPCGYLNSMCMVFGVRSNPEMTKMQEDE